VNTTLHIGSDTASEVASFFSVITGASDTRAPSVFVMVQAAREELVDMLGDDILMSLYKLATEMLKPARCEINFARLLGC
jgi:hypothetical protein